MPCFGSGFLSPELDPVCFIQFHFKFRPFQNQQSANFCFMCFKTALSASKLLGKLLVLMFLESIQLLKSLSDTYLVIFSSVPLTDAMLALQN
jgi:hypothetical protein